MGRVARSHYVPRVGRLPGQGANRRGLNALHERLTLMQYLPSSDTGGDTYVPPITAQNYLPPPVVASPVASTPSSSSGWTSAQEASVLTSAINAAGVVGKQAIIGSPTVSYNPATGQYTATGGATLPSGLALSSSLSSLLSNPMILLAIAGIVVVMAVK